MPDTTERIETITTAIDLLSHAADHFIVAAIVESPDAPYNTTTQIVETSRDDASWSYIPELHRRLSTHLTTIGYSPPDDESLT